MKTCVFIAGTNCVGKTTLAKYIIKKCGGVKKIQNNITYLFDNRVSLAGSYKDESKYGGVDCLSSTKILKDIVQEALLHSEVIICEGSFLHTFGLNLTNAMFQAKNFLYIFLYCPVEVINYRLKNRSSTKINKKIIQKQKQTAISARKFQKIGVDVISFDTSKIKTEKIAETIFLKLKLL